MKRLVTVEQIADRQASDHVERRGDRVYLVDGNGSYAPVQVQDREGMDSASQARYLAWVKTLASTARIRWHMGIIRTYAGLSEHSRKVRLEALAQRDRELWREKYGDASFAVPEDSDVAWSMEQEKAESRR